MTIQRDRRHPLGLAVTAVVTAVVLVVVACALVYRLSTSKSRARAIPSAAANGPLRVAMEQQRLPVETKASATIPEIASPVSLAAAPTKPEAQSGDVNQPFVEARRERRDSIWALQMESSVRDALVALGDEKVTLQSVQCASIRCTVEGSIGEGGKLQDVVSAASKIGLTRARFKRVKGDDGATTFSAVLARKGYKLDGSPKEVVAEAL